MEAKQVDYCACGSDKTYIDCCGRYLDNGEIPQSAEVLMRSRYTAYTLGREDYLLATWYADMRPEKLELFGPDHQWLGLTVKRHVQTGPYHAIVEFVARYQVAGQEQQIHEISRFLFEGGRWLYVDGDFIQQDQAAE